jgi:hypothetical protein
MIVVVGMIARCNFEDVEDSGSVGNHLARAFTTPGLLFDVERGISGYAFENGRRVNLVSELVATFEFVHQIRIPR